MRDLGTYDDRCLVRPKALIRLKRVDPFFGRTSGWRPLNLFVWVSNIRRKYKTTCLIAEWYFGGGCLGVRWTWPESLGGRNDAARDGHFKLSSTYFSGGTPSLAAMDEMPSSESKVSSISCPPLPAMRKTEMRKHCSINRSRLGRAALTGSSVLNVMMCPSIIGDMFTKSTKRSLSSGGIISILAGSTSIPSSFGFSKCRGIYRILALSSFESDFSSNGSRMNVPSAQ